MKTKQILCGALATLMLATSCFSASAAQITNSGGAGQTLVTYGMSKGFLVTIPADFAIDDSNMATADISASNVMIGHGEVLNVSISGRDYINKWELIDTVESDNRLEYTIGSTVGGRDIVNNSVVLSVAAGEAFDSTKTETMHFTVVDELTKAGTYIDTLTFTVGINVGSLSDDVEGDNTAFAKESPAPLVFRSKEPINDFQHVLLDGEIVDDDNYTVTEGSTIVTFKEAFLHTLPDGNYNIELVFKKTSASASFQVAAKKLYIASNEFGYEEGMTWGDWLNSKYNVYDLRINENPGINGVDACIQKYFQGNPVDAYLFSGNSELENFVKPTDLINSSIKYQVYSYENVDDGYVHFTLNGVAMKLEKQGDFYGWWNFDGATSPFELGIESTDEGAYMAKFENGVATHFVAMSDGTLVTPGVKPIEGHAYKFVEIDTNVDLEGTTERINFTLDGNSMSIEKSENYNGWWKTEGIDGNGFTLQITSFNNIIGENSLARMEKVVNGQPTGYFVVDADGNFVSPGNDIIDGHAYRFVKADLINFTIEGNPFIIDNRENYNMWFMLEDVYLEGVNYTLKISMVNDMSRMEKYVDGKATGYYVADNSGNLVGPGTVIVDGHDYKFVEIKTVNKISFMLSGENMSSEEDMIWGGWIDTDDCPYSFEIVSSRLSGYVWMIEEYENGQGTGRYIANMDGSPVQPGDKIVNDTIYPLVTSVEITIDGAVVPVISGATPGAWNLEENSSCPFDLRIVTGDFGARLEKYEDGQPTGYYLADSTGNILTPGASLIHGEAYQLIQA